MKFFNSVGPNPRVVRVFMAELGLTMDQDTVDIMVTVKVKILKVSSFGPICAIWIGLVLNGGEREVQ